MGSGFIVIPTLWTGAVEVFKHGWRDSPSHPLGCQGKILEAIRGAWPERERERPVEERGCLFLGDACSDALRHNRGRSTIKRLLNLGKCGLLFFLKLRGEIYFDFSWLDFYTGRRGMIR